jgi:dihydroorotase
MTTLIKQIKIVDPASKFHGEVMDILVENGKISKIAKNIDQLENATIITGKQLILTSGWVDVFADFSEPGFEHKETISSGLKAARNGGFKHIFTVPNTVPVIQNKSTIDFILNQSRTSSNNIYPIGALSKNIEGKDLAEMLDMHYAGAIAFSDGWNAVQNPQLLLKSLEYVKAFDGIVIQLPVNAALSAGGLMNEGFNSVKFGMPGIPNIAESLQVYRDIELAKYTQSKLHFTGISTKESIALIKKAKAEGVQITCSVTPYHLLFTDDNLETYDSVFKVNPPLRSEEDRQALIAAVLDGTIDCIASHHRSHEWDSKAKEFEYTAYGMNTLETSFAMVLQAIPEITAEQLANFMSLNAKTIFKISMNACIVEGSDDFTIVDFDKEWTYNETSTFSLGKNSPLFNQKIKGKAICL